MLIRRAEVDGSAPLDVRLADGRIAAIDAGLSRAPGEAVLEADRGALLPGLHDHHLHLFALAAAWGSVRCGPPEVRDKQGLAEALREWRGAGEWVRGVGYHESVAGVLTRSELDALLPGRPLRIQHRSGALWMLNSTALSRLELDGADAADGVERAPDGRPTGRLFGLDAWLRGRLEGSRPPELAEVGRRLARLGLTGLTDTTPSNGPDELGAFEAAIERGNLPQRLVVMGSSELGESDRVTRGPVKLLLRDEDLPAPDQLEETIRSAHAAGRRIAVHCVTRVQLVLTLSALRAAGSLPGDRIEHASVTPPDAMRLLAGLPVAVVTQPNFVRERGDEYAVLVDEPDRPWLYRGRGFLEAGVALGGGTDAPFGDPDPWAAMRASVERRTESGLCLGPEERLNPEQALALFTSSPEAPGGAPRAVEVGRPADLCLLDRPWSAARRGLSSEHVAATIRGGSLIWRAS